MSDSIALWRAEHANFATLLDLLEGELDLFHKGGSPNYDLMLDIMFYMTHYPDVCITLRRTWRSRRSRSAT